LRTAIEYGDINIINKVIHDILSKRGKNDGWLKDFFGKVPGSWEKFIYYAKRTSDMVLMEKIHDLVEDTTNLSFANVKLTMKWHNEATSVRSKEEELGKADWKLMNLHKDPFLSQLVKNQINLSRA